MNVDYACFCKHGCGKTYINSIVALNKRTPRGKCTACEVWRPHTAYAKKKTIGSATTIKWINTYAHTAHRLWKEHNSSGRQTHDITHEQIITRAIKQRQTVGDSNVVTHGDTRHINTVCSVHDVYVSTNRKQLLMYEGKQGALKLQMRVPGFKGMFVLWNWPKASSSRESGTKTIILPQSHPWSQSSALLAGKQEY